ncbi:caspase family protein [uncultured Pseudodesulfovibrio sp.]|uniref:caspase family protein n=1 Tax=uncultured Pseudodesulfovibrio sp. TaxID=2035858 RepID=UPI0029C6890C|nr:caspase family protein [uncultured Pseudodesulfovibrio sp.]
MKRLIPFLVLFLLILSTIPAAAADKALLIGIGKYRMKGIDLPGIDKDIETMHKVALTLGYKPENIKILTDEQATLKNIRTAVDQWLIADVGPEDRALFYFSGHGSQIYDTDKDESDNADEVLVCNDVSLGVNTLNNVLVDDMFRDMLKKMRSSNVFILIDACHSGTATRAMTAKHEGIVPKFLEYPGMPRTTRAVSLLDKSMDTAEPLNYSALSAAQDNQRAQASTKGSFFTLGIQKAVESASKDRSLDMTTLYNETTRYISDAVPEPAMVYSPALVGDAAHNEKNLFVPKALKAEDWITQIRKIAGHAAYDVKVRTNGTVFRVGEPLNISCTPETDGYLNVVTIQPGDKAPTILFPNKFHQDNHVEAGRTVSIPGPTDTFELTASPPVGKALVAIFHSPFPVNFYRQGYGDGAFRTMDQGSTRGFVVIQAKEKPEPETPQQPKPESKPYGAGILLLKIK